jgi:hypothetical protein
MGGQHWWMLYDRNADATAAPPAHALVRPSL